jgi:very-short-patch-repair endonuclease
MKADPVLSASANARQLARRERQSGNLPEVLIWRELRKRPGGYKFRRQHPLSEIVLDFACLERRLAIEIDGEAHNRGDRPARDGRRDAYLATRGFAVLRLPARYVLENLEGAIATIVAACDDQQPLRMGFAHRPLRTGEVLEDGANLETSLHPSTGSGGETGLRSKPERPS